jgi:tetratricopeptide (TPR) repeat protein
MLDWFNSRDASEVGAALADEFAPRTTPAAANGIRTAQGPEINAEGLLERVDRDVGSLRLNFYKKAKLINSFKWRLLENGVAKEAADELTQKLVLHLSLNQAASVPGRDSVTTPTEKVSYTAKDLFAHGNKSLAEGAYPEAIDFFQDLLRLNPRHAEGLNNLGATFCKVGRYREAEGCFRRAVKIKPTYVEAHHNLGNVLRSKGHVDDAESWLRRAVKLNPNSVDARVDLGLTLVFSGRVRDGKAQFQKVLKSAPRNAEALQGLGHVAAIEGRFEEAAALFARALEANPKLPSAWASAASIRKMTPSDATWLAGAEEIAASGIAPLEESDLRFAIGKYHDDLGDFKRAFQSYQRANELVKTISENYDRGARTRFVDDMIRVYTRESITGIAGGSSDSMRPVFVVGMPRSGTSLAEQIIASHPAAAGAGELRFWTDTVVEHHSDIRKGLLGESTRTKLAEGYLHVLAGYSADALRIVDKSPINSDHLGVIHSVFPNARILYMRRDPIDTCLSCYFQKFHAALNFTMDLSDLAHYHKEHRRLMAHWRAILPPGTILDVPYEELVADQATWSRKILGFIGLEWDERCLNFHETQRPVVTSSYWQVRQKIYRNSVQRWRNYQRFVGPLLDLKD